ncbi:DUF6578 domain-containing protein [Streptomyces sp. NPDC048045]|uniref:DUF6578 domain-containing protein n=1 Tax=Streptomyces sp. NPDC048045 TaxID=3154710 RepID=UPI0034346D95
MPTMRVFYEDWQMECCGRPFSVGDEICWRLAELDEEQLREGRYHGARACVENHGDVPRHKTMGRVRSIDVVHQDYAEKQQGSHTLEPVPGTVSLEPVGTCPKWFRYDESEADNGLRRARRTDGVLVTLELPGSPGTSLPELPGGAPGEPGDRS